jgi:peptide/nickel transport system ATP-binding protein
MVFQDPFASLDPRWSAAAIIGEGLDHGNARLSRSQRQQRIDALMTRVGLDPALANRYPHEFSGGQRQRLGISRALAAEPQVLICDAPISALDVSIQAQVLNLLSTLRRDLGLAILFIAHDLAVVRHLADRTAVMHQGHIVEHGPSDELFAKPQHPYTRTLLAAAPRIPGT